MNTLHGFEQSKEQLAAAISRLSGFFERPGDETLLSRARVLYQKLASEQFNLVVLGQFKRGKSTLINALLGADLLPTAVVPLTSIVTIIHYAPQSLAFVRLLDGGKIEVDISDLSEYITERDNPNNMKGVSQVEVAFPSEFLKGGVRLVDTPGVGSVFASNTGTTYDYLPEADAAIFLLAADQPISQAELDFLHAARRYAAKFFFIQNKIDYLSERELEESMRFSARVISESLGSDAVIHPVSARAALLAKLESDRKMLERSRLPEVERVLSDFLLREKGTTLVRSVRSRLLALVSEALDSIELELSAIQMPAELLAERIEAFRKKAGEIIQEQIDMQYLLRGEISELTASVEKDLRAFVDKNVQALTHRIIEMFEQNKRLGKGKLIEAMNDLMARAVEEAYAPWREGEEQYVRASFDRITLRFVERANRIISDIRQLAADLFDVRISPIIEVEPFTTESSHYYYTESPFTLQLSMLPLLLPGPLAKRYIKKQFFSSCREELDRNAGRLRSDFQERLERSAFAFRTSFDEKVKATLYGLEQTLRRAAAKRERGAAKLASVQARLEADRKTIGELARLIEGHPAQSAAASEQGVEGG